MSDVAQIITALAALLAAIGTFVNTRKISDVKHEVKTANSQTLAQLADAVEGRRIDEIPERKRSLLEKSHLRDTE